MEYGGMYVMLMVAGMSTVLVW